MFRRSFLTAVAVSILALSGSAHAATAPELFRKMKTEYSLAQYSRALETLQALDTESARPENEHVRAQLEPAVAFYRGAILASLGRSAEAKAAFRQYLDLEPNAGVDPGLYSSSVVKAFEQARKERAAAPKPSDSPANSPANTGSLAKAFERFHVTESVETGEHWSEGPVQFIMTPEESEAFSRLSTPQ